MADIAADPTTPAQPKTHLNVGYEMFIGALSLLSVVNLLLLVFVDNQVLATVIWSIDILLAPIFLADFAFRLVKAPDRKKYFFREWGWADLVSSLPFPRLKILRVFRLWRVVRLIKRFGARGLLHDFQKYRAQNALLFVGFLVLALLEFGSIAVLYFEIPAPNANITTAQDAFWWVYVTVTTVGYGDKFPVTLGGRIVAMMVMTAGVGLFGTLSGYLANKLLSPPVSADEDSDSASADAQSKPAPVPTNTPKPVGAPPVTAGAMVLDMMMPAYVESANLDDRVKYLRAVLDAQATFNERIQLELAQIEKLVTADDAARVDQMAQTLGDKGASAAEGASAA